MDCATLEPSLAPSSSTNKLDWRRLGPLLLATVALAGCSIYQDSAQAGADIAREPARRLQSHQLAAGRPKTMVTLAMSQAVQHRLVVAADYICTPSGFGRKATCRARSAEF